MCPTQNGKGQEECRQSCLHEQRSPQIIPQIVSPATQRGTTPESHEVASPCPVGALTQLQLRWHQGGQQLSPSPSIKSSMCTPIPAEGHGRGTTDVLALLPLSQLLQQAAADCAAAQQQQPSSCLLEPSTQPWQECTDASCALVVVLLQSHGAAGAGASLTNQCGPSLLQPQHPSGDCEWHTGTGATHTQLTAQGQHSIQHNRAAAGQRCTTGGRAAGVCRACDWR